MVEIKKGKLNLTVPAGSVRKYISAGWELANGSKLARKSITPTLTDPMENGGQFEDEETSDDSTDEEVEYVDPEELAQKPLNELDREELRILAEYKGVDVTELTSTKQLRAALRALE